MFVRIEPAEHCCLVLRKKLKMFDKLKKLCYFIKNELIKEDCQMEETQQKESEEVPTLETKGTTFRITELKIKIQSIANELWFIRLQENKCKKGYHRSQSKIISKYVDKSFIDSSISLPVKCDNEKENERRKLTYENLQMRSRYIKAKKIAKQKHPEVFMTDEDKLGKFNLLYQSLYNHRKASATGLCIESRAAYLAYGFMRGRSYSEIETNPRWKYEPHDRPQPDWLKVRDIIYRFTSIPGKQEIVKSKLFDELHRWKGN